MAKIVSPSIRKIYKNLIRDTVEDLNKPIKIFLPPDKADCPNCRWDFINQKSSGTFDSSFVSPVVIFGETINPQSFSRSRCPVCLGEGILTSDVVKNAKALVKWNPRRPGVIEATPVGRESSPVVRIKLLRKHYTDVINSVYFLVDGVKCELDEPPTIRGLGTQEELVVAFLISVEEGSDVKK